MGKVSWLKDRGSHTRHFSVSSVGFLIIILFRRAAGILGSVISSLHDQYSYRQSTTQKQTGEHIRLVVTCNITN
jgi:hypothetical protein